jgi:hypothetical protein
MDTATIYEIIGYVGSALVLVSFLMASVVKLRVVNAVGSTIFAVYALLIHSYPTMIMNICLVLINLYYLWKLRNSEPNYRLVSVSPVGGMVEHFLSEHREDISKCFPGRNWNEQELNRAFLVCHGDTPAGLLLGREHQGVMDVALDYSSPAYRDSSEGRYLIEHLGQEGLTLLRYEHAEPGHLSYLQKLGYEACGGHYERKL